MHDNKYSVKRICHERIKLLLKRISAVVACLWWYKRWNAVVWRNTVSACFIGTVCEVIYRQLESFASYISSCCVFNTYVVKTHMLQCLFLFFFYSVLWHLFLWLNLVLFVDRNHLFKGPTCKIREHLTEGKRIANTVNVNPCLIWSWSHIFLKSVVISG